jgi:hypothetical protein
VEKDGSAKLIDKVQIDLKRYGTPKIDQHKMPVPPAKGPRETMANPAMRAMGAPAPGSDSTSASERILAAPPPGDGMVK